MFSKTKNSEHRVVLFESLTRCKSSRRGAAQARMREDGGGECWHGCLRYGGHSWGPFRDEFTSCGVRSLQKNHRYKQNCNDFTPTTSRKFSQVRDVQCKSKILNQLMS